MNLTPEQVVALAPDDASVKAGRGLVNPSKWPTLGKSADALWGECQGSGSKPYQVCVDLTGPAFKCTCPSRKFPCKHGLGLMLIAAEKPGSCKEATAPPWTADWLASRREKAEKKATAAVEKKETPPDPEAAAKKLEKRLGRMKEGGEELARWLQDQVRSGIASYPQQPSTHFRGVAARMVDAQVPGLANEVGRLESAVHSGESWPHRTLAQLGRMHLLTEALLRYESLPVPLQAELRSCLGWNLEKDEVLISGERIADAWYVVGQTFVERERLWERRTWLIGENSGRAALLLDFSHGNRSFQIAMSVGSKFNGSIAFYPGAFPLRGLLVEPPVDSCPAQRAFPTLPNFSAFLERYADALALNPWLQSMPLAVDNVVPSRVENSWKLTDQTGAVLTLKMPEPDAWELLAVSGGAPLNVFGEWNGSDLRVLSYWMNDSLQGFVTA